MDYQRLYQLRPSVTDGRVHHRLFPRSVVFPGRRHRLYQRCSTGSAEAIAPRLWAYEVRNRVLMGVRRKRITAAEAKEFLVSLASLPIRLGDPSSYDAVFDLARSNGLTVYDAAYLDLALREGLPLASLDAALVRAAEEAGAGVFKP